MSKENIFLATMIAVGIVVVTWLTSVVSDADRARVERTPIRQEKAAAWIRINNLDATATCFEWTTECDVVPHVGVPYRIDCAGDVPCRVVIR